MIFSRFPLASDACLPLYLFPGGRVTSDNEQIARYRNPIPRVQNDDALSTLENSLGRSFLSARFTPTPTCSTRSCLGIGERERPRYLPFRRGGMEKKRLMLAQNSRRWRGRSSRVAPYSSRRVHSSERSDNRYEGIAPKRPGIRGKEREVGFYERSIQEYPRVQHRVPSNASDLRETFRSREIIADGNRRGFSCMTRAKEFIEEGFLRDGESTIGVAIEISLFSSRVGFFIRFRDSCYRIIGSSYLRGRSCSL